MLGIGVILITVAILCIVEMILFSNDFRVGEFIAVITLTFAAIMFIIYYNKPTAIDVYRGKTELKITKEVVNDKVVSSDTTVIYKNN